MVIHPIHPEIVTIGAVLGKVYFWKKIFKEDWAKFIPRFTEKNYNDNTRRHMKKSDLVDMSLVRPYIRNRNNEDVDVKRRFCPGWYDDDSEAENEEEGKEEDFYLPDVHPGGKVVKPVPNGICSEEFLRILTYNGAIDCSGQFQWNSLKRSGEERPNDADDKLSAYP